MNTGLYSGVAAMRAAEKRLETVTTNLANASTGAYKRQEASAHAFSVGRGDRQRVELATTYRTNFAQGPLERTGNPFDLALMGEGFFAVEGRHGEVFTRNGEFRTDENGVLQTRDGYPVAWDSQRGRLDPVGDPVSVDLAGTVFQGETEIGRLRVVAFAAPGNLDVDGEGYFHASPGLRREATDAEVHQFSIERSNVSVVEELVTMIQVQRSFESAASLMEMLDQTYRRLNNGR